MLRRSIRTNRRFLPPLLGASALVVGVLTLQAISPPSATVSLASDERNPEQAASRGSERSAWPSDEVLVAQPVADQETTTTVTPTTAVTTTVAPTSTTQAPTTTAPPATTTTTSAPTTTIPTPSAAATGTNSQSGKASYYLYKAGGCAHKTLPKGTVVTVTNVSNGKSTTCVVNDRGPFVAGRIIDLDTRVFKEVASTSAGVFNARISW